ncbi:MAG TPA: hypothetical protein VGH58_09430 [Solirubrobacterales bacterium]|jgi:hypothetical protein
MAETKSKKVGAKKRTSGSTSKAKSKARGSTSAGSNGSESIAGSVKNGAQGAIEGVSPILQKAKLPLLAGGAAVAGVAGAILASKSGGRRKVLGVSMPKRSKLSLPKKNGFKSDARKVTSAVADAAKRADDLGQGVSRIASSVRKVGETADEAVKKS